MVATGITTTAVKSLKKIYLENLKRREDRIQYELEKEREKEVELESRELTKGVNKLIKEKFPWLGTQAPCSCSIRQRGSSLELEFKIIGSPNGKIQKINDELTKLRNNREKKIRVLEDWEIAALKAVSLSEKKLPDFKFEKEN